MKAARLVLALVLCLLLAPAPASAHTLLSELLLKILLSDVVLAPPAAPFQSHEAHFRPIVGGEVVSGFQVNQLEVPLAINSIMASQLATIPLGSSSGGFSYKFDSALGSFTRESSSFGSAFVERALTAGRGRWNAGFNFQRATYDTLEGQDLDSGEVRVHLVHQDCCAPTNQPGTPPGPFFEGDIIENRLSLDLTSSIFSAFLNYGVTDRLDVGIVVPFVTIDMNASVQATVIRLATGEGSGIHSFEGGATTRTFSESSRAQGLGDVLLRGKFRFFDAPGGGLAGGVDVRLPTGDSEQLLGTGGTQVKVAFIGSMGQGPFSPHVNMGYTFSSGGSSEPLSVSPNVADEFNYAAGFDTAVHPRVTVSADILGRVLKDIGRLVPTARQFPFVTSTGTFGTGTFEEFTRRDGDMNLLVGVLGVRYNPRGNLLISAEVLVPVTKAGLRDKLTPVIGIDYSF